MSFHEFKENDIIHVVMETHPAYEVISNGAAADVQITGSVYLEKRFLNNDLEGRTFFGFSQKLGGLVEKTGPFTSSIEVFSTVQNTTKKQVYETILELYNYYSIVDPCYTASYDGGAIPTTFRVFSIPQVYYDRGVLSGSLTASDVDSAGDDRYLYDNGRGGIYSGSMSGTIVGNIFYSEGLMVLKKSDLSDFGGSGGGNLNWKMNFKGLHKIPVKIFKCRAPSGELNRTTNSTFYSIPTGSTDEYRNMKVPVLSGDYTYITAVGLYNEEFELVGLAKLAQPIKKDQEKDLLFKLKMDF